MKTKIILKISVILLLSSIYFCSSKKIENIRVPGIVNGDIITIKSKTAGTIISLNFKEGQKIIKKQILTEIDSRNIDNKLAEIPLYLKSIDIKIEELKNNQKYAFENKKYLLKQINRFKRLVKKKSISGEKLENIELKFKKIKTEISGINHKINSLKIEKEKLLIKEQSLKLVLEDHNITSPVNGVIIEKFISEGENIFPSKPIADILDLNTLYIEIFVEGEEVSKLKLGDKVRIYLDGITRDFTAEISYFGKKAEFSPKYVISEKERKSLLYLVKIKIEKDKEFFKIGMPVNVVIDRE